MHTIYCLGNLKGRDHLEDRKDNIRLDLREIGWRSMDWIHLVRIEISGRPS
jgi:hypothetical protein